MIFFIGSVCIIRIIATNYQKCRLSKPIEQKIDINATKEKIDQYCKRVRLNLDRCTLQDKKEALNALDIQVVAIPQEMKIRIAVPLELIIIER